MRIRLPRGYSIDTGRGGITVWPCPVCERSFLNPANRDRHIDRKHKITCAPARPGARP